MVIWNPLKDVAKELLPDFFCFADTFQPGQHSHFQLISRQWIQHFIAGVILPLERRCGQFDPISVNSLHKVFD